MECQRHLFEIPDDVAYLNCAYMSPQLRGVTAAGASGVARKVRPWELSPTSFFDGAEETRAIFAELIDASADDVAFVPAASYGLGIAAANVSVSAGSEILLLGEQFPSNVYPWRERAAEAGARVVFVERPADDDWTAAVLERIGPVTSVVSIPAVHWAEGGCVDLVSVRQRADDVGAALVLDLSQSLGAMPFSVAEVRPDFMVCPTYKWLFGPYSMGFLYVAPRWQQGRPLEYAWINRGGSEDFARLVEYRDDYQAGARRFDVGERANFALMPMVRAALRQILDWNPVAIAAALGVRNRALADRASGLGFQAISEDRRAPHYLALRRAEGMPADIVPRLGERGVHVSRRGECLRVTPHLYNNDADVDRLLGALAELI